MLIILLGSTFLECLGVASRMSGAPTSLSRGNLIMFIPVLLAGESDGAAPGEGEESQEEGRGHCLKGAGGRAGICQTSIQAWPVCTLHLSSEINSDEDDFQSR